MSFEEIQRELSLEFTNFRNGNLCRGRRDGRQSFSVG